MITFYWQDVVLIPGIAQGLFLALVLWRIKHDKPNPNKTLGVLLLSATLMLVARLVWFRYPSHWPLQWSLIPDTLIFLFGPLIYFYVNQILRRDKNHLHIIHFLPGLIHLAIAISMTIIYSAGEFRQMAWGGNLNLYFQMTEGSAVILNLGYWGVSTFWLLKSGNRNSSRYLSIFLMAIFCSLLMWGLGFVSNNFIAIGFNIFTYDLMWITVPLFIYVIGYFSILKPDFFRNHLVPGLIKKKKDRITREQIEQINETLNNLISNKIHTRNDLTLAKLAAEAQSTPNNVSWVLNEIHGKSFYDFVNELRVREFKQKIKQGEHYHKTLLAMAMEVGFNSKSTFNKAFRLIQGCSPSEYMEEFDKLLVSKAEVLAKV